VNEMMREEEIIITFFNKIQEYKNIGTGLSDSLERILAV
jgi:hypothetical protein